MISCGVLSQNLFSLPVVGTACRHCTCWFKSPCPFVLCHLSVRSRTTVLHACWFLLFFFGPVNKRCNVHSSRVASSSIHIRCSIALLFSHAFSFLLASSFSDFCPEILRCHYRQLLPVSPSLPGLWKLSNLSPLSSHSTPSFCLQLPRFVHT
jgi:hypothetical protein